MDTFLSIPNIFFFAYWLFLCDFTLGMAIWSQVSRVYSWEQPWVWLDWRWLSGWLVNRYLQPIFQKTWLTDRLYIQKLFESRLICKKLEMHACSKTGISSTKYIWLRHFAGGFFFTLFFFPEIFTVSSKTPQLSSWWISFHQWIIFTN